MNHKSSTLIKRKQQGQYFTQPLIAQFMVREIFKSVLANHFWEPFNIIKKSQQYKEIKDLLDIFLSLRFVDPAMGDGVFLLEILSCLENFLLELWNEVYLTPIFSPVEQYFKQKLDLDFSKLVEKDPFTLDIWKFHLIRSMVYGVDLDPEIVEKAKANMISRFSTQKFKKLAANFIHFNLKIGNSLISYIKMEKEEKDSVQKLFYTEINNIIKERSYIQSILWSNISLDELKSKLSKIEIDMKKIEMDLISKLNDSKKYFKELKEYDIEIFAFIWELEFPEVFFSNDFGFNVILGNPPWDKWKLYNREWLGSTALGKNNYAQRVSQLRKNDSKLDENYLKIKKYYKNTTKYFNEYYKWQPGEKNLYKLFLERFYALCCSNGFFGIIVPGGLLGEYYCQSLRYILITRMKINLIAEIISNEDFFGDVEPGQSILIILAQKSKSANKFPFIKGIKSLKFLIQINLKLLSENDDGIIFFDQDHILRFSPKQVIPAIRSKLELIILKKMIEYPILSSSEWGCKTSRGIDMTNDRDIIDTQPNKIPLIEGRHLVRLGYDISYPRYWISSYEEYKKRISFWDRTIIAWKNFSGNHRRRRMRIGIIPPHSAISNSVICLYDLPHFKNIEFYLAGIMCSIPFEFRIRQLCYGLNINQYVIDNINIPLFNPSDIFHQMIISKVKHFLPEGKKWAKKKLESKSSVSKSKIERNYIDTITLIDAIAAHIYKLTKEEFHATLCAHQKLEEAYILKALINYDLIDKNQSNIK